MHHAPDGPGRVRFGVFELDLRTGELWKRGLRIRLQEQPFQVLAMLLEKPRQLVTREDLRQRLWTADTFVDFDHGLNKAINKIRGALGDAAASPRFIETVARRGYRFIADVASVETVPLAASPPRATSPLATPDRLPAPDQGPLVVAEPTARHPRVPGRLAWTMAGVALALVSAVGWIMWARGRGATTVRSLAVLPLDSLSSDPSQEYFADGMTDQLITTLGQISALRVISRTSVMAYKHTRKPLPQIARELNVDAVVEGTVLRSGAQVRITAQLIDAVADRHLWAQSYDGDLRDTLALQNTVARTIAEQIRINVTAQEQVALQHATVVNPDAYEAYLKGRYFWNKRTGEGLQRAKGYFDQAVATDPHYAQAYSGLADTYALLGDWQYAVMTAKEALPRAKAAAVRALELDPTLGEAHTSLGFILDGFDWDGESADREFRRGIALNPGYATAHHWYAWHLSLLARHRDAIAEMRKAESLDPLSLIIKSDLAELLLIAHFADASIQQSRRTIDLDVTFSMAHNQLGQAYLQQQQYEEAIAELQKAIQLSDGNPTFTANLARAYAAAGRRHDAVQLLNALKRRSSPGYSNAPEIAVIYTALGDRDQAMRWLEQGYEERFNPGVLLRPGFDPLRSDPRFQALARRVGLHP
jgi:TolB-like protein/DNA-binding winged helix-turn-helix (wHTH) protein/Flp pilus assembly protein TadD